MYLTQQAFEQVLQHGQTVKQHGKEFASFSNSLLNEHVLAIDQAAFIESIGQQIQQSGQIMTALAEESLQKRQYPLADYVLVHQQHRQVILLYIQAIKVIILVTMQTLIATDSTL